VPMGWPVPKIALTTFAKYWLRMGPIALILLGQLAVIPLLWRKSPVSRALYAITFLLFAFFVYTRLHDDVFGGHERVGWAEHSVPRYLTPAYLFAALPLLLLLGQLRQKWLWIPGAVVAFGISGAGLYEIGVREPSSFQFVHNFVPIHEALLTDLKREIPAAAMVYTVTSDKLVWSQWRLGTIEDQNLSSASMERALKAGFKVFMLDPKYETLSHRHLGQLLAKRGLVLSPVDLRHGLYRLRQGNTAWPPRGR
jgi:hypothetical protein